MPQDTTIAWEFATHRERSLRSRVEAKGSVFLIVAALYRSLRSIPCQSPCPRENHSVVEAQAWLLVNQTPFTF